MKKHNFFELRLRLVETFYNGYFEENYTFGQCGERCFYEYSSELQNNNIESINITLGIIMLLFKHKESIEERYVQQMKTVIDTYSKLDLEKYLEEEAIEVVLEEIEEVKLVLSL